MLITCNNLLHCLRSSTVHLPSRVHLPLGAGGGALLSEHPGISHCWENSLVLSGFPYVWYGPTVSPQNQTGARAGA